LEFCFYISHALSCKQVFGVDAFKRIIVYSIIVSLVAVGFIAYVAGDMISGAKIPDAESGVVASKGAVTDNHAAAYSVTLEGDKVLYIVDNSTLFNELTVGSNFAFTCRIDLLGGMTVIDSVTLKA
jgi:hypothetical protein